MKKSLILLGMLSIGYANAQEGNIGINTEEPKATLHIQPSAENLTKTTNEGIIAPKLTKARIAGIADANLVEGTLVYATDATYTGANTKVSKITEKGYYFYNGTEWVKIENENQDSIWVNDVTKSSIKIAKLSNGITDREPHQNVFINNNGRIGIGTDAPVAAITIKGTGGANDDVSIHSYSAIDKSTLFFNRYRGSSDAPEAVQAGDELGEIIIRGYNGRNIATSGISIRGVVSEVEANTVKSNLIIDANNYVGIKTSAPTEALDAVVETARIGNGGRYNYLGISSGTVPFGIFLGHNVKRNKQVAYTFTSVAGDADSQKGSSLIHTNVNTGVVTFGNHIKASGLTSEDFLLKDAAYMIAGADKSITLPVLADTSATADRTVVVDKAGKLKVGSATSTGAASLSGEENLQCNDANRGKMNFVKDVTLAGGKTADAFAVCLKGSDGNHYWRYLYGAGGETTGSGNFGTGLQ